MKSSRLNNPPKEQGAVNRGERRWNIVYVIVCLALLTLTAFQFITMLQDGPDTYGWDYRVFRGGVQAIDHMQNPYVLENLNLYIERSNPLPFAYPPHTLYFFWILDLFFVFQDIGVYYALLVILMILSGYLIATMDQKPRYFFLVTLMLTGFMGTYWNFRTGNKDIFFLFLFAVIFTLLAKENYWQSSIAMGLMGAVSLITGPFVALYFFVKRPWFNRLSYIGLSGAVVAILFAADYWINPVYLQSYIGFLIGGRSPLHDAGGYFTPTPYQMLGDLLKGIPVMGQLPVAVVWCLYIGLVMYMAWNYSVKNSRNVIMVYSLVTIAVFLLLPRIKPYDFIILAVPLYFLFRDCSYRMKILMFALVSLPLFAWYASYLHILRQYGMPYIQTCSLILIFLLVVLCDYLPFVPREKGNGEKTPERGAESFKNPAS